MEKNTYCMLHMLFKSFEDVILDDRDSLWSCFVTTAKWYLPKTKNLFISPNWICPFTSSYWTVCEFFNLLLSMLVQLKVDPFTTALWCFHLIPWPTMANPLLKRSLFIVNSSCLIHVSFFETPRTNPKGPPSEGIGLQAGSNNMLKLL